MNRFERRCLPASECRRWWNVVRVRRCSRIPIKTFGLLLFRGPGRPGLLLRRKGGRSLLHLSSGAGDRILSSQHLSPSSHEPVVLFRRIVAVRGTTGVSVFFSQQGV